MATPERRARRALRPIETPRMRLAGTPITQATRAQMVGEWSAMVIRVEAFPGLSSGQRLAYRAGTSRYGLSKRTSDPGAGRSTRRCGCGGRQNRKKWGVLAWGDG